MASLCCAYSSVGYVHFANAMNIIWTRKLFLQGNSDLLNIAILETKDAFRRDGQAIAVKLLIPSFLDTDKPAKLLQFHCIQRVQASPAPVMKVLMA